MSATVHQLQTDSPTVDEVIDLYFTARRRNLSDGTVAKYRRTFAALRDVHGDEPFAAIDAAQVVDVLDELAGHTSDATYNRHRAALSSLWAFASKRDLVPFNVVTAHVERASGTVSKRAEERQRAMPIEMLERLWGNRGADHVVHPLRERAFWRLAYDTAARADELLNVNVEDVDLDDRSAPVVGKGGDVRRVRWHTGTNRLLRDLIGDRASGPLFLTERLPTSDVAAADLCPHTGRARLSYTRAWEIFSEAAGEPWTLHHLRHSRLTHLGEQGLNQHQLAAISGHKSPRSLDQYVHVSDDAVKRLYDEMDPAARRRPPTA